MPNPFFTINDDKGNPINKLINRSADSGKHFGDSKSVDGDGNKYPKGFTPPVDLYVDTSRIGESGLPVEYGESLTSDGELIGAGPHKKTDGNGFINIEELKSGVEYVDPENINPETGLPFEYGSSVDHSNLTSRNADEYIDDRIKTYDNFNDYSSKEFTHLLDYFVGDSGQIGEKRAIITSQQEGAKTISIDTSKIYLGSFIQTSNDNEDPTMLGYDIEIKMDSSPLFNGEIDEFLDKFSGYGNSEIESRKDILKYFRGQLLKFLRNDSPSTQTQGEESNRPDFLGTDGTKVYYLKNINGLDKLVDNSDSNQIKSFIDYGKDFITLQFWEDVSQNIGFLSSLYKSLSWSRINGKQVIPENLLRFDIDITITEIRKFNRVIKSLNDKEKVDIYPDLISKYVYSLYECQFFFSTMPHGDSLDLSSPKTVDTYDIKMNYKFSTMKFIKFFGVNTSQKVGDGKVDITSYSLDNKESNLNNIRSINTNKSQVKDNSIENLPNSFSLESYRSYSSSEESVAKQLDGVEGLKSSNKPVAKNSIPSSAISSIKDKLGKTKPFDKLKKDLSKALINEVNRQILTQAALLNKTLENIRNSIPHAGRMSEPTNVYSSYNIVENDIINSLRNFVGGSIKGFFQKP